MAIPAAKHPELIVHQVDPYNAGPPLARLRQHFLTPPDLFFVRSHGAVPAVDPAAFRLAVGGQVQRPREFSLADLQKFPPANLIVTLQCAGNRRDELIALKPIPGETPWSADAISTALWTGARLRDVLATVEPRAANLHDELHVAMLGLDCVHHHGLDEGFGGSIPLAQAMQGEALLAWEMNGEPLPPSHGFPLRAIIPGVIGARSVKWLSEITLQPEPSSNYFQAQAYKHFPPDVGPETADWAAAPMLNDLPVNAVICQPRPGARLPAGPAEVRGYALAGAGRAIARVEVSADAGESWQPADLGADAGPAAWRLWSAKVRLPRGPLELAARAWDSAGDVQPADLAAVWNFKGYLNNAWHRVRLEGV